MVALVKETKGEVFIKAIEEAKNNKGHIFSLLLETLQNEYPQAEAVTIVNKVKNFDALVNYDASLAKFQIGRNGDNIRKTMEDISSTEVLGEDNFKYKQLMIKKTERAGFNQSRCQNLCRLGCRGIYFPGVRRRQTVQTRIYQLRA